MRQAGVCLKCLARTTSLPIESVQIAWPLVDDDVHAISIAFGPCARCDAPEITYRLVDR
jgi:hypothetical protein